MIKPGGLALVLKSHFPENVGKCVTTERLIQPKEQFPGPDGKPIANWTSYPAWYITGAVKMEFFSGRVVEGYCLIHPEHLLPINPDVEAMEREAECTV